MNGDKCKMNNSSNADSKPFYIRMFPSLSNYVVGITLVCYLAGFAITNAYLGSLGIVNLDLLRARYVLTGLLFLLFLGAITYLIYGLVQTLRKHQEKPPLRLVWEVIWHSFQNICILSVAIPAISILAGSLSNPPVGVPGVSPVLPWSDWFATRPASILKNTVVMYGITLFAAIIIFAVVIAVNPKDKHGVRTPRRHMLAKALGKMKQEKLQLLGYLLGGFAIVLAANLILSLLTFIRQGKVSIVPTSTPLSEGWSRYLGTAIVIYALVAVYLTQLVVFHPSSESEQEDNPTARVSRWIYFVALAVGIIVPVYAFGVYPNLPQQIGGGRVIRVEVITSSEELKPFFADSRIETYLIDHAPRTSLFLLVNKDSQDYRVVEVASSLIQSITYNPFP